MSAPIPSELLTYPQVAAKLGVCLRMVEKLVKGRKLRCLRIGRSVRFRLSDIEAFLSKSASVPYC